MKRVATLYTITFVVAFCSIAYELILGQTLAAFLGNTVLRYSVTIGLYLFAMGFGAMLAGEKFVAKPFSNFMKTELALTVLGGLAVVIFFLLSFLVGTGILFSMIVHGLILIIGVLTGFEIPLLIEMVRKEDDQNKSIEPRVLGIDYAGAFVGSIVFAFVFYPKLGLVPAAFVVGFLNALAGLIAYFLSQKSMPKPKALSKLAIVQGMLSVVFVIFLINSQWISDHLIERYLK